MNTYISRFSRSFSPYYKTVSTSLVCILSLGGHSFFKQASLGLQPYAEQNNMATIHRRGLECCFSTSKSEEFPTCPALVPPARLKQLLSSAPKDYVLVDASVGKEARQDFARRHIPGAVFFDLEGCTDKKEDLPNMAPTAAAFEEHVGRLGIGNTSHVIAYDNNDQVPMYQAQRVWWLFRLFGHNNVALLEGGLPSWLAAGGSVTDTETSVEPKNFKANIRPELIKNYSDVVETLSKGDFTVVDTRPAARFQGKQPEPRPGVKSGCIPGSTNIPYTALMDSETRTMRQPQEIMKILKQAGVDVNKPVIATCATGMTACTLALAAYQCGKEDVAIYDGSWAEWYIRAPPALKKNVPEN